MSSSFQDTRVIRVFISSTFRDMQDERDELMKKTFPVLRRKATERDVTLTELDLRWGITPEESESGKVVEICLREIENSVPFFIGIIGNRYGWIPGPGDLGESLRERYSQVDDYVERRLSVTEMEMQFGVLERREDMHAYFFLKEQETNDVDEPVKLAALKKAVKENDRYPVSIYSSPEDLARQVEEAFTKLLDELFPEGNLSELEKERIGQRAYLKSLCQNYIRTESNFAAIDEWVEDWEKHQLVITGASGLGKSALVANWVSEKLTAGESFPYKIIYHFVGNGGSLGSHGHVIKALCDEIQDRYGFDADEKEAKTDEKALEELVKKVAAEGDKSLLIVLDAINQIIDVDNSKQLNWLPIPPKNVKILFTTLEDDQTMAVFKNRHYPIFTLQPLTKAQRADMVEGYLEVFSKKLLPHQVDRIITDKQCENTLVLKTLLDELVNFGIFEKLDEKIGTLLVAESVEDFYMILLKGYESDFGEPLVKHVLSLVEISRNGLSEEEILSITKEKPLHWSQFFCAICQHLIVKKGLISFAHEYIRKAVQTRYLRGNEKWERNCREEIVSLMGGIRANRAMDEVPYQYNILMDYPRLHDYLLDLDVFTYIKKSDEIALGKYWRFLIDKGQYSLSEYLPLVDRIDENKRASVFMALSLFCRNTLIKPEKSIEFIERALPYSEAGMRIAVLNHMGISYGLLGNHQKALEYEKQALETYWSLLGDKNKAYLALTYNNLGYTYGELGDRQRSLENNQKALQIRLSLYGECNTDVAQSYNNLGSSLLRSGQSNKALDYEKKALEIWLSLYGSHNPDVANAYNNVGYIYGELGVYQKALEYEMKALEIRLSLFGEHHPSVAQSYINTGHYYGTLGNHRIELKYKQKALEINRSVFGANHPIVASSYNCVGGACCTLGDYDKAKEYSQKALEIYLSLYGENHPDVAGCYHNVGCVLIAIDDIQNGIKHLQKSLDISLPLYGENHPFVARVYRQLGSAYWHLGDYKKTLEYKEKAREILQSIFGEVHPDVAEAYDHVGVTYESLGDHQRVLINKERALVIRISLFGENHPAVAESYRSVGFAYREIGNLRNALDFEKKTLDIELTIHEKFHPDVASSYIDVGMMYGELGDYQSEIDHLSEALKIILSLYGEERSDVANLYNNIGAAKGKLGDVEQEIELRKKGLGLALRIGDETLSATLFNRVGRAYKSDGQIESANDYFRQAAEAYDKLGDEAQKQENLNLIEENHD